MVAVAGAFEAWTERAAGVDPGFTDKDAVARGLTAAAPMDAGELEEGMIAYGALAALGDPRFVEGVRDADRYGAFGAHLASDPYTVSRNDGSAEAAARVDAALAALAGAVRPAAELPTSSRPPTSSGSGQAWVRELRSPTPPARLAARKTCRA